MTTSKILNLVVEFLQSAQNNNEPKMYAVGVNILGAAESNPYEFQLAIQAIQKAAAQADVAEHLAADEERT